MQGQEQKVMLEVRGMTCGGCVSAVKNVISEVPGVREANVDLKGGRAEVLGTGIASERLVEAVTEAGFEARVI